jgi:hypothetical protein
VQLVGAQSQQGFGRRIRRDDPLIGAMEHDPSVMWFSSVEWIASSSLVRRNS